MRQILLSVTLILSFFMSVALAVENCPTCGDAWSTANQNYMAAFVEEVDASGAKTNVDNYYSKVTNCASNHGVKDNENNDYLEDMEDANDFEGYASTYYYLGRDKYYDGHDNMDAGDSYCNASQCNSAITSYNNASNDYSAADDYFEISNAYYSDTSTSLDAAKEHLKKVVWHDGFGMYVPCGCWEE